MIQKHSGLTRTYLPTFSLDMAVPSVQEIDSNTEVSKLFVDHVTKNHKGLNWKIFRYTLNPTNYKSFVYAFAITALNSNPCYITTWQFVSNAKRMRKSILRNNIVLSKTETNLLNNCINYQENADIESRRKTKYTNFIENLKLQYLG